MFNGIEKPSSSYVWDHKGLALAEIDVRLGCGGAAGDTFQCLNFGTKKVGVGMSLIWCSFSVVSM